MIFLSYFQALAILCAGCSISVSYDKSMFSFARKHFQSGCGIAFLPAVNENSGCSTSSSTLNVVMFQILAFLIGVYWYLIAVLKCISLMTWCGTSFHRIIHYLFIFGEVPVKVFVPFPNFFFFNLLRFEFFIYFGWSFLFVFKSEVSFVNIFSFIISHSLEMSFTENTFFISMKSNLSIISFMDHVFNVVSKKAHIFSGIDI